MHYKAPRSYIGKKILSIILSVFILASLIIVPASASVTYGMNTCIYLYYKDGDKYVQSNSYNGYDLGGAACNEAPGINFEPANNSTCPTETEALNVVVDWLKNQCTSPNKNIALTHPVVDYSVSSAFEFRKYYLTGDWRFYIYLRGPYVTSQISYSILGTCPQGAVPPTTTSATDGSNVSVQPASTIPGYSFSGWTTSDATVSGSTFTMPTHNVSFTGSYTPRTDTLYTVKFYKQNDSDNNYTEQTADSITGRGTTGTLIRSTQNMATLNSKYLHCHLTDASKTNTATINGNGTGVLALYYDYDLANVSYAYSGITPPKAPPLPLSAAKRMNSSVSVAAAPTLAGYDFSGWETTDVDASSGSFIMPATDIAFSGSWTPHTDTPFTVEYYQQNIDDDNYTKVDTYSGTGTTDTMAVAPGKDYPGFTMTPASVTASTNTNIDGEGTTVLKLYYDRNINTVTYAYSGDIDSTPPVLPETKSYRYGQTVTLNSNPTLTGYDFGGWETSDATVAGNSFAMPDAPVTMTGTWVPRPDTPFVVEYYQQNLADPEYTKVDADTYAGIGTTGAPIPQAHKEYEGFTETGPSVAAETATKIASNGSTVLKLYYDRNSYAVTYAYTSDHIDGEPACPAEQHIQYGAAVTVESDSPELAGYHFDGWNSEDVSLSSGTFTMPAKDVAITGAWLPNTDTPYTVEYYQQNVDDDEYSLADTVNGHGTTMETILEAGKTYPGFTMTAASAAEAGTAVIAPDGSTVLKLFYDRNVNPVTYAYSGDTPSDAPALPASATYRFGKTITLPAAPVGKGSILFNGWETSDAVLSSGAFTMPDKPVTVRGAWYDSSAEGDSKEYTATLISDNTPGEKLTPNAQNQVKLPEGPAKDGYTFVGWAESDGGTASYQAGVTITLTKSMTFYAVYAKKTGAFIYGYRDGTFRPENNLTTYQSQLMLARLTGTTEPNSSSNSQTAISRKAFLTAVAQSTATTLVNNDVVETAMEKGWVKGFTNGAMMDDAYITRAQAVIILNRAFTRSDVQLDESISYTDLPKDYWAYDQIIAASAETIK